MAQIFFKNPNDPPQPHSGVYKWYFKKNNKEFCVYVGNAGGKNTKSKKKTQSTLMRGASQASRATLSSDSNKGIKYRKLDTDFVLGTCIQYIISKGVDCFWEHVGNNPKEERDYAARLNPLIQNQKAEIPLRLKMETKINNYWKLERWDEAEKKVFDEFRKILEEKNVDL